MLEYVPVIALIVSILYAYVSYRQQQKTIRQQAEENMHLALQLEELRNDRKQDLIKKYYPPRAHLIEN